MGTRTNGQDADNRVARFDPFTVISGGSYKVTLKQTAGTGRSYIWSIHQL
jgi:hypothetical protein